MEHRLRCGRSQKKYGAVILRWTGFVICGTKIVSENCFAIRLDRGCFGPSRDFSPIFSDFYGLFELKTLSDNDFFVIFRPFYGLSFHAKMVKVEVEIRDPDWISDALNAL